VFVDPPYALPLASLLETIVSLTRRVDPGGVVVIHRRVGEDLPENVADLALTGRRRYGSAELWRYAKENQ
jgi:16S rRNA G966 N2-methylase RsmD